jgi:hypothetical protein
MIDAALTWPVRGCRLIFLFALAGIAKNDASPFIARQRPLLDLIQGSEAAKTSEVIAQTAISYARRLSKCIEVTH